MSDEEYVSCLEGSDSGNESPDLYEEDGDSMDSDGVDIGLGEESACSSKSEHKKFNEYLPSEVLSTEQIVLYMEESIKEVNDVTQIPKTVLRLLLNHFKWDQQKLMEKYFSNDQEAMFTEAKVPSPNKRTILKGTSSKFSKKQRIVKDPECQICYLSISNDMMFGLDCGHIFCTDCWTEYLRTKIMDEGTCEVIKCPDSNCDLLVDDETITNVIKNPKIISRFGQLITNTFVQCNRLITWCSGPDCSKALRVSHPEAQPVKCQCGHTFCFICSEKQHNPVTCKLLKLWIKKCEDDSETSKWLTANTKDCPKCNTPIEKNGGCNHIMCFNKSCKYEFCWKCMGAWSDHGYRNCNKYDPNKEKDDENAKKNARVSLDRYLFYFNHYNSHFQSKKFEKKLYVTAKDKMEEMQKLSTMSYVEVQFLHKAVDILCECRTTLMYSYVFAHYLKKNNQAEIFETNQRDLDTATETLSEYLERDIATINDLVKIKQEVQDKYSYCDSRRRVLLDHVNEGYAKNWWIFP